MATNLANQPRAINADREAGAVTIDWADGHTSKFDTETLRLLCPCAYCQGEAGRPGWLDTNPTLSAIQTQLVSMRLVGQYALAPTWADGHDTGYYTFEALRERCPCPACTARREATK
jgi:ATP-binding protein involved in chromosome partitioning